MNVSHQRTMQNNKSIQYNLVQLSCHIIIQTKNKLACATASQLSVISNLALPTFYAKYCNILDLTHSDFHPVEIKLL